MKKLFSDIICLLIFFFIVGVFVHPTIIQHKLPVPTDSLIGLYHPWRDLYAQTNPRGVPYKNYLITDPIRQQIPWRKLVIDELKQGKFPLWNPYSFSGSPLFANIQSGTLYPGNIVFFLFDFPTAWTILIISQLLLSGLFLYIYLRHIGLQTVASLIGALAWSFSGFSIAWLTWGTIVHVALWLPIILLSIDEILKTEGYEKKNKRKLLWFFLFVFFLSSSFLAGHTQIFLYTASFTIVYSFWKYLSIKRSENGHKVSSVFWILAGFCFFVIITSIQWIPMVQFIQESARIVEQGNWLKAGWFVPWQHLIQFLVPDIFGNPATLNYWGEWNYGELVGYIGVLPIIMVFYVFVARRDALSSFFKLIVIVSLILFLPTPIAKIPYMFRIPVLSTLQPTRLMVLVDFCLAVLAALGIDHWLRRKDGMMKWTLMVVGILFFLLWVFMQAQNFFLHDEVLKTNLLVSKRNLVLPTLLFGMSVVIFSVSRFIKSIKIGQVFLLSCLVVFVGFDLVRFAWKFTPFTPLAYFFPSTKAIAFLQAQSKPFRIMSIDPRILPPNASAYYGLESIEGYDPLYFRRYEEYIAALERGKPDMASPFGFNRILTAKNVESPLTSLLNVRYVLSFGELSSPKLIKAFQEGQTYVYELTESTPRFYLAQRVTSVENKQKVMETLYDASFRPGKDAVIEESLVLTSQSEEDGAILVDIYDNTVIQLSIQLTSSQFLVISNMFDVHWRAFIDDQPMKLYRTNFLFQGLVVPAGSHKIVLRYE